MPKKVKLEDGLDLTEAEHLCLWLSPRLRVARLEAAVPRASAAHASAWDDPELELEVGRILDDVDEPWILGFGVQFSLPVSGERSATARAALRQEDVATWQAFAAEREELLALREAWLQWSFDQLVRERLVAAIAQLTTIEAMAKKFVEAGALKTTDARILTIALARRKGELASADAALATQRQSILARIGLSTKATVKLTPTPASSASDVPTNARAKRLAEHHPSVQLALARLALAGAEQSAALRRVLPSIAATPGIEREEGETRATLGLALPLPLWNRNRQEIAERRAAQDAARLAVVTTYQERLAELSAAERSLAVARQKRVYVEKTLAPLAHAQVEALAGAAKAGDIDSLVFEEAVSNAFETDRDLLHARRDEQLARLKLASLLEPSSSRTRGKK